MARILVASLFLVASVVAGGDEAKKQRQLMERDLFPLMQQADRVVIYSLYPIAKKHLEKEPDDLELAIAFGINRDKDGAKLELEKVEQEIAELARSAPLFNGFPVLSTVTVELKPASEVAGLLETIQKSMLTAKEDLSEEDCFNPRHGLLLESGERRLMFTICFECGNTVLTCYPDAVKEGARAFGDFSEEFEKYLNGRFKAAGVTFAPYKDNPPKLAK